ncbi:MULTISPECIES: CidA/LrgA family protein [Shewanella]|jgi:holin-like protein|uniref:CidA/LrgA family protein n=1 Tax=Shewanella chilikensis TaxID=558541 RepID=A0A6G7LVL9_9GAMM|nr:MULTISPECIES: CidA/LrgA family protein [Shewanella]MBO2625779.1 CidA/LrgA family protein [Shewanella algae]MCA0949007.1 CidA/LrgA family protein [Shewanella chilikensis]MCE9852121.1 CidA/LrgA family protein [Shewanella chilikensis]MCL1153389.1 CidA/LrgA family protein [Shewanella chilikensis]MCL1163412.1 CidA/LrgA family protein [Shewanella chilikensis]
MHSFSKRPASPHRVAKVIWLQGKHISVTLLQIAAICLLAWATHALAAALHSPIPGSVLGMLVVLLALGLKLIPEKALQLGAAWLIGDLLLFFIPPVISVLKYETLLEEYGFNIMLTLVLGSASVLLGTGFVVDRVFRFERRLNLKRQLAKHGVQG